MKSVFLIESVTIFPRGLQRFPRTGVQASGLIQRTMKAFSFIMGGLLVASATWIPAGQYSELWGEHGEKWSPQSRLPDFSFAGYHCGEKPLPNVAPGMSVKEFGAKGDGVADDTQASSTPSGTSRTVPSKYRRAVTD